MVVLNNFNNQYFITTRSIEGNYDKAPANPSNLSPHILGSETTIQSKAGIKVMTQHTHTHTHTHSHTRAQARNKGDSVQSV